MKFKFKDPFKVDRINLLSESEKLEYLEFLCKYAEVKKIPTSAKKSAKNEEKLLTKLLQFGIITLCDEQEKYWQQDQWYLTKEDYAKLNLKYSKDIIDSYIQRFKNWTDPSKLKRESIYLSLNNWLRRDNKGMSEEQKEFAEKSWSAYVNSTGLEIKSGMKVKYFEAIEGAWRNGVTTEDIREYLKKKIVEESEKSDKKYVKNPSTVIKEFMKIQQYKNKGGD